MIEPGVAALLLALGTWAALDGTSVAQIMISRPLVSGALAGIVVGAPGLGLLVGAILEAAHLGQLPVGSARLAEPGPAAVPAVAAASIAGGAGGIALGVGVGAVWSLAGGSTMVLLRRLNGVLVRGLEEGRFTAREVALRHWAAVGLDGVRGLFLTGSGLGAAVALSGLPLGRWALDEATTVALLLLPGALSVGVLLGTWSVTWQRGALFAVGLAAGWVASGLVG